MTYMKKLFEYLKRGKQEVGHIAYYSTLCAALLGFFVICFIALLAALGGLMFFSSTSSTVAVYLISTVFFLFLLNFLSLIALMLTATVGVVDYTINRGRDTMLAPNQ